MGVSPILYAALRHDVRTAATPLERSELIRDLLAALHSSARPGAGDQAQDTAEEILLDRLVALADAHLEATLTSEPARPVRREA